MRDPRLKGGQVGAKPKTERREGGKKREGNKIKLKENMENTISLSLSLSFSAVLYLSQSLSLYQPHKFSLSLSLSLSLFLSGSVSLPSPPPLFLFLYLLNALSALASRKSQSKDSEHCSHTYCSTHAIRYEHKENRIDIVNQRKKEFSIQGTY